MKPLPPPEMSEEEMAWRHGWAFAYSGAANLYGDDGELQDNRWPHIDWMRDSSIEIRDKIYKRGMLQYTDNKEQIDAIFARLDQKKK